MKNIILLILVLLISNCSNLCENEVRQEIVFPNKNITVTAFIRNCGATTDFSPQVFIHSNSKFSNNAKGNVFIGNHSDFIRIEKIDGNKVIIEHKVSPNDTFLKEESMNGIMFIYKFIE